MPAVYCALHDVAIRSAESQDPTDLLAYSGAEDCPADEHCGEVCDTARLYRYRFGSFRRNEYVPEGENPAVLWTRLCYLAQVERLNRESDIEPPQ